MFNLNYYLVDVGDNYCTIAENDLMFDLQDAIVNDNLAQLKLIKEYMKQSLKKKCAFSSMKEFKIVLVNKAYKMAIESEVEDVSTRECVEPLFENKMYNAYLMTPKHALTIRCQVVPNQIEHRYIKYQDFKLSAKQKTK